jgi:hypothetical protein
LAHALVVAELRTHSFQQGKYDIEYARWRILEHAGPDGVPGFIYISDKAVARLLGQGCGEARRRLSLGVKTQRHQV